MKRELQIVNFATGEIVQRIDVTGKSDSYIERCERGILINMDTSNYCVRDTIVDEHDAKEAGR